MAKVNGNAEQQSKPDGHAWWEQGKTPVHNRSEYLEQMENKSITAKSIVDLISHI